MHCGALTKVLMTLNVILIGLIAVAASTKSQQQCSWSDEECPGYQRKCIKGWWTSIIVYGIIGVLVTAGFATGVGGAIGGGIFAICAKAVGSFLGLFGFLPAGIKAGSFAAWLQSSIGTVKAGSLFAYLQSLGAKGLGGKALAAAVCTYMAEAALPQVVNKLFDLTCYWEKVETKSTWW